jgi:hypothetical protein
VSLTPRAAIWLSTMNLRRAAVADIIHSRILNARTKGLAATDPAFLLNSIGTSPKCGHDVPNHV